MDKKKRPLTLAGTIVNVVFAVIDIILMFFAIEQYSSLGLGTAMCIPAIVEILFAVAILVFAIILMANCSKSISMFKPMHGIGITLFVFNCIAVILCLLNIFGGNYLQILTMLVYAMCGTFALIDVIRNKKALAKKRLQVQQAQNVTVPIAPIVEKPVVSQPKVVSEKKDEARKRPLTLSGTIVNIVFAAIDILVMLIAIIAVADVWEQYDLLTLTALNIIYIMFVIEILFATTILVLSSVLIGSCNKSVRQYNKKTALAITLFVFNCIAVLSLLISIFTGNYFAILTMLVYAMCGTFVLVDVCRNKKAIKRLDACVSTNTTSKMIANAIPVQEEKAVAPQVVMPVVEEEKFPVNKAVAREPIAQQNVEPAKQVSMPKAPMTSMLYQNLTELKEMKEMGIITEEEYKKLKAKVIDKAEF